MTAPSTHPERLLLILPSWVGDAVMVTPALRRIRAERPGTYIGGLCRPGVDRLLEGLTDNSGRAVFDELHVARPTGVLGPKHAAAKLAPRRYGAALLFTGSFSTALIARIAGIPKRIGYARDGRAFLLTRRLRAPKTGSGAWAIVPAVSYYWHAASALLDDGTPDDLDAPELASPTHAAMNLPPGERLTLPISDADRADAQATLDSAGLPGLDSSPAVAILNPGGNNPAKRWPAERFAAVADHLTDQHGLAVLLNGSPAEAELCRSIAEHARTRPVVLPDHHGTLGGLKALCSVARLMITNDTGPRHIAVALGAPVVSLFGPTDPRWTSVPVGTAPDGTPMETVLVADETLPPAESSNDHPERCAVDRIETGRVIEAADRLLDSGGGA